MRAYRGIHFWVAGLFLLPGILSGQARKSSLPAQLVSGNVDPGSPLPLGHVETGLHEPASTLIDWTPQQIRNFPSLHSLQIAGSQNELPIILQRAGQAGDMAYQEFPRIACDEAVTSKIASPPETRHKKFQYIVFARRIDNVGVLEEYRTYPENRNLPEELNFEDLFMITSGFASTRMFLARKSTREQVPLFRNSIDWKSGMSCCGICSGSPGEHVTSQNSRSTGGKLLFIFKVWLGLTPKPFRSSVLVMWLLAPLPDFHLDSMTATVDFSAWSRPERVRKILVAPKRR